MTWIFILLAFVVGLITGITATLAIIAKDIREADISSDDKRFICDTLGIEP